MSQQFVETIREGQRSILSSFDEVQRSSRVYKQAKPLLRDLHEKITDYLARQDVKLMKQLLDFYHEDRKAVKMLEFLSHDLKDIKVKFLIFHDKHSGEVLDLSARSFPKDLQDFTQEWVDRFNIEEEYLFPLLEGLP